MSESIVILAAQALAAVIAAGVPDLVGKISVVQEAPTAEKGYPLAAVMPEPTFRLDAAHDLEVRDADGRAIILDDGRAFMSAGSIETSARIWLAARSPAQREKLQARILRLFFGDEMAPTRLTVTLSGYEVDGFAAPATWPVSYFVDDGEWQDEMAFSERRWVVLRASVSIPILLLRDESWRIDEMLLAIAAGSNVTTTTDDLDEVLIDSDGQFSPAP